MPRTPHLVTAGAVVLAGLALPAGIGLAALAVDGDPRISFRATASPGALSIDGKGRSMTLVDDGTTLRFVVPLDTLETGISLRDTHMKENYLQTDRFPEAVLEVARASVTEPAETGQATSGTVDGTFTVHGVARTVPVTYEARRSKSGFKITGSFPFNVRDHGIEIPSYLGVTIDPAMKASVRFDVTGP